jgi:hypothetical protein
MGNYTGSKTVSFTIKKCAASKVTFGSVSKKVYTGKQIKPTPSIKYNGNKLVKDTDFKVTYENNIKTGKATISVRLIGNYSGSKTLYFNIIPKQVTVSSVKKSASGKFKATWKTVNCTGYQISYSTSSSFKSSKSVTVTSSSAKSKTVSGLKKGKTYYVRVRAYVKIGGTKYYGSYSKTVKVKV